jgi:hypothetical protein
MRTLQASPTLLILAALAASGCAEAATDPAGTPALRAALFDTIIARVERRDAFSPIKNERLGFDPLRSMRALRESVVTASSESEFYYALARLSHARRDRHLDLYLVPGGVLPADVAGLEVWGGEPAPIPQAPVRIFPDYSSLERVGYFVGDVAAEGGPAVGDRIVAVGGTPVAEWHAQRAPYMRHSTEIGLRWKLAEAMGQATAAFPPALRSDSLRLTVTSAPGGERSYALPYVDAASLEWTGAAEPRYPGHTVELVTPTYDLLVPEDGRRHVVIVWRGFRETMVADIDTLVAHAAARGLLDHAVVMDVTRSRGGSLGPYAMQALQPRPFRTTFGNLRISDVIEPFVAERREDYAARDINDGGVPEAIDDGAWQIEWLEQDVMAAVARGDAWSNDVPFKLAHAPRDSNGVLEPAPVHFRGPIGIISGPQGGSHLDQFLAILVDNDLGPAVGMPPGGYSNTWEWEEILTFAGTDQPVVGFMYSIGHSLRPNGEIIEGNPVGLDEWIPLTADNVREYYPTMLARVLALLGR